MPKRIVHLSLTNRSGPTKVEVVQYSTEPYIDFVLDDYLPPTGSIANFYIEKKDGNKIYNSCSINNNIVTYEPTTQSFTDLGINKSQLEIIDSTGVAVSFIILLVITENIIDDSAIESQDEFTALQEALQTVSSYDGRITSNTNRIAAVEPIAETAVLHNDTRGAVKLNGNLGINKDSPTINLTHSGTGANSAISALPADVNGNNLLVRAGGNLIIGGGEYAANRYEASLVGSTTEATYIGADSDVYIETNAQTIGNAKRWIFNTSGNIVSPIGAELKIVGASTKTITVWGNDVNKVSLAIFNTQDNKQWELQAREDRIKLYNQTDAVNVYDICPNITKYVGNAPDDTVSNIPSGSWTTIGTITYPSTGSYLLTVCVRFASNATGYRAIMLTNSEESTSAIAVILSDFQQAVNGTFTMCRIVGQHSINSSNVNNKFYIKAIQNSGASLGVAPRVTMVKCTP